ncbi:COG4705 family protein [Jatrophihabitans fulvus]
MTHTDARPRTRVLNKVPEVTVWFWVIKILCTTVGESLADYINETLGFGLTNTTLLFGTAFVVALAVQFALRRYVAPAYWIVVVLVSVVGTLLTDNLTDGHDVPLRLSTTVFAVLLLAVFGLWYLRERTLSIHSITTPAREAFYWLTVLVTFALGTAAGDWTLELTGWSPGAAIVLPAGLILLVLAAWWLGAGAVLCFWLAYVLTRPLGANIGDYLSSPSPDGGLGLGTLGTSLLFLGVILATVTYLAVTKVDRTEVDRTEVDHTEVGEAEHPGRVRT